METFTEEIEKPKIEIVNTKKFGLECRNIGVTRINLTVFLLFLFMNALTGWVNTYNVYFI
jgi:hypothetical protein